MPKKEVNYSNTIIYKIYCKDESITEIYVGHTTNFIQRKYAHKFASNNSNNTLKIYNVIRSNGGWDNWDMIEIAKYNCKDSTEARIKEQQHYDVLKASLNSCPPYVDKNNYFCNICNLQCKSLTQYNKHIFCESHIKKTNEPNNDPEITPKYLCEKCNYVCYKKYNWEKHLTTSKHSTETVGNKVEICKFEKVDNYNCNICQKEYKTNCGLWKHKQKCISNSEDIKKLTDIDKDELIITLLKQNAELIKCQQYMMVKLTENGI